MSKFTQLMFIAVLVALFGTTTAHATKWSLEPVRSTAKTATFEVKRLPAKKVKRVRFVHGGKRRVVRVKRLRRSVAHAGYLTIRSRPTPRLRARAAGRKTRKLVVVADTTAPETTLTGAPSGTVATRDARLSFASTESGRFECSQDGGTWRSCTSPTSIANLADGAHRFAVRAVDAAGNADASPATASWTVAVADAPAATAPDTSTAPGTVTDGFDGPNGSNSLITNQYAFWGTDSLAVRSSAWEVTSGSLFSREGRAWSGRVDAVTPDRYSTNGTGSYVFRMRSKRAEFGSTRQEVSAKINSFYGGTASRPAVAWDGVVLWPRYDTEFSLYFGYILRKDGRVGITKKCPGQVAGGDYYNGGSYFSLYSERFYASTNVGQWYRIGTDAQDNADGSVTIRLLRDGKVVAEARDTGVGCAPIKGPARIGIRADNAEFELDDYVATPLS